jgi:hypothetical protein
MFLDVDLAATLARHHPRRRRTTRPRARRRHRTWRWRTPWGHTTRRRTHRSRRHRGRRTTTSARPSCHRAALHTDLHPSLHALLLGLLLFLRIADRDVDSADLAVTALFVPTTLGAALGLAALPAIALRHVAGQLLVGVFMLAAAGASVRTMLAMFAVDLAAGLEPQFGVVTRVFLLIVFVDSFSDDLLRLFRDGASVRSATFTTTIAMTAQERVSAFSRLNPVVAHKRTLLSAVSRTISI